MTLNKRIYTILLMAFIAISCNKKSSIIVTSGTIQIQGITTYQYGTHIIPGYALRSNSIDLDNYIGQTVTVKGHLIDGYPVENGPD